VIEPTDEMANAGWDALPVSAQESGEIDLDDMKVVLAAVFAIVERDYEIVPQRPRMHVPPPEPCPFCSVGDKTICPWHGEGRDTP